MQLDAVSGAQLQSGALTLSLEWRNALGNPTLRLYRAAQTNGGLAYLTNEAAALQQIGGGFQTAVGTVSILSSLTLPTSYWAGATGSNFFRPFLLEGYLEGEGQLVAVLKQGGTAISESPPVFLRLSPVLKLFEHYTAGDSTATEWNAIPAAAARTTESGTYTASSTESEDYLLFVHGWRMQPWERRAFAATAYKRLWWQGYKGRFGLFSWPTDWMHISFVDMLTSQAARQNYDRSERRGWHSAVALRHRLIALNRQYPGRVRLMSHSMGGVVASEALRLQGRRPGSIPVAHTYVGAQSASVAHAYDAVAPEVVRSGDVIGTGINIPEVYAAYPRGNTKQPYFTGLANAVGRTVQGVPRAWNYTNFEDYALNNAIVWPANQLLKPDSGWTYSDRWWRGVFVGTRLDLSTDAYEIFAHIAIARSKALGCSDDPVHVVRGEIGNAFDLNSSTTGFGFKDGSHEHSAEFNSTMMRRHVFWRQMLGTMSLTDSP